MPCSKSLEVVLQTNESTLGLVEVNLLDGAVVRLMDIPSLTWIRSGTGNDWGGTTA